MRGNHRATRAKLTPQEQSSSFRPNPDARLFRATPAPAHLEVVGSSSSSNRATSCRRTNSAALQSRRAEAELLEGRISRIDRPDVNMTKRTSSAARTSALRRRDCAGSISYLKVEGVEEPVTPFTFQNPTRGPVSAPRLISRG